MSGGRKTIDTGEVLEDALLFVEDARAQTLSELPPATDVAPWRVLVVDDDEQLHTITGLVLAGLVFRGRPVRVEGARSGSEAVAMLESDSGYAVVLLDVVMETDDAGLRVVQELRERLGNYDTRVVLRTGQPGLVPVRELVLRYDVDGYESKAELTAQRLFTVVVSALRSYERASSRTLELETMHRTLAERARGLEEAVAEQTAELDDALRVTRRALAAKDEFLAVMSHEMRTPLHGILGAARLLEHSELDPTQRKHLGTLVAAGRLLGAIIEDILDLAQMEHAGLELHPSTVVLGATLDRVLELVRSLAAAKGIAVIDARDASLPEYVRIDETRLQQVLLNLLSNAVKFTSTGSVTLRASAERDGEETRLRFQVIDTGIGIAPDAQARLFQPFTQADPSIRRRFGGTGLGLSICRRIVDAMTGEISLESELGRGTSFEVSVPVEVAAGTMAAGTVAASIPPRATPAIAASYAQQRESWAPEPGSPARARSPSRQSVPAMAAAEPPRPTSAPPTADSERPADRSERAGPEGLVALVVDDNAVNQMLLSAMLARVGVDTDGAFDGEEALERVAERGYDLIFMDVHMPRMDGLTAASRIRDDAAAAGRAKPYIVAVTANARTSDRESALAAGMDAFLSKPFAEEALYAAVAVAAERRRAPGSPTDAGRAAGA
jgi:signal transduction histidine kinase